MKFTYRIAGIVVLSIAVAVAAMSAVAPASADPGRAPESIAVADRDDTQASWFPIPPELEVFCGLILECAPCGWAPECQSGLDGRFVQASDTQAGVTPWFPIPPELTALCGTLLECKPCGGAPECQSGLGGHFVQRGDSPTPVAFPWFPVPPAFVWAICVGLADIFECKQINVPMLEDQVLKASAPAR